MRAAISPMVGGTPEEDCGAMGAILPAMLEVTDGGWVFTIVVVVVGDEERRRGSEKGELTRVAVATHSGTGGGRREESGRSTMGGRYRVGEDSRQRKEGERGKGCQLPSQSRLNSKKSTDGLDGIEEVGGDWAGEEEAIADVGCRACERKALSLAKPGPSIEEEDSYSANEKGKSDPGLLEFQSSRLVKKKVLYGSRKLWSTFFPPSSEHRQGIRCSSEPILHGKIKVDSEEDPKTEDSGEKASLLRKEADLKNSSSDEDMEGFLGRVGSDPRGSAVMVKPSSPETRGKGPNLLGNCGSMVAEILEVTPSLFQSTQPYIPPSSGFTKPLMNPSVPILSNDAFEGQIPVDIPNLEMEVIQPACPYQMFESVNSLLANLRSPIKESSKATVNLGGIFQVEEQMLHRIARLIGFGSEIRVREFHMKIISWNTRGLGSKKKRRVVKDFLRSEKPDVVMIQETKKECDRREEVVLGSFSVSIKFALDGCESLWLSAVYGPNNSTLRKDFWVELSDIVGLAYPRWCVGGDFNVIRRSSKKLGGSRLTPSMKDFDDFIRDCELIDLPLRSASFTWSNMQENPVCKRLDCFLYSNEWEQVFPQSLQGVLPRWTSDHWPIVLETNPFKWGPMPFRFENMWLQHPNFKESLEDGGESFKEMGGKGTSS
ncbi:hypothetical protein CK203_104316 [Vitis vinifera]|uniref:Endonuclease/exonuclease/phosphatase domain-containing protein n=1 Tax=Vitis vinifera TaxID=29760 RepID=A0A438EME7_VITVI|nr:hypothetical protein CK203_104316 [Vitis vinifera]